MTLTWWTAGLNASRWTITINDFKKLNLLLILFDKFFVSPKEKSFRVEYRVFQMIQNAFYISSAIFYSLHYLFIFNGYSKIFVSKWLYSYWSWSVWDDDVYLQDFLSRFGNHLQQCVDNKTFHLYQEFNWPSCCARYHIKNFFRYCKDFENKVAERCLQNFWLQRFYSNAHFQRSNCVIINHCRYEFHRTTARAQMLLNALFNEL